MTTLDTWSVNPSGQLVNLRTGEVRGDPWEPPANGMIVTPSGIWGAGFQNAGDKFDANVHPEAAGVLITGADVAGTHLSPDYGSNWTPNNSGLLNSNHTRCGGLRTSPSISNRCYYYSSTQDGNGTDNWLWIGTYDPSLKVIVRWEKATSTSIAKGASAGNTQTPGSSAGGHPRQVGRKMLAIDEVGGFVYLGTTDGIYRVNLSTRTSSRIALAGEKVTSVCLDPQNRTILFASTDAYLDAGGAVVQGAVYRISSVTATPSIVSYAPLDWRGTDNYIYPQTILALVETGVTRAYVATGKRQNANNSSWGIARWNGTDFATGTNWTDLTATLNADETNAFNRWVGIDAVRLAGDTTTRLLVTHGYDISGATGTKVAWADWSSGNPAWVKVGPTNTDNQRRINDTAGATWWLTDTLDSLMIDKGGFDSMNPIIDPNNHSRWYLMGRSGIWRNIGGVASTMWHPIVKGTAITTSWAISSANQKSCVGDVDWTFLRSSDGFRTQPIIPNNRPSHTVGWNLARRGDRMVVFAGDRDENFDGAVYRHDNPWSSGTWTNEVLSATNPLFESVTATPHFKGGALGSTDGTGATPVILAARTEWTGTAGGALHRKVGLGNAGTWSSPTYNVTVPMFLMSSKQTRVHFAWPNDGAYVWMVDPSTGLWQSQDRGISWTRRVQFSEGGYSSHHIVASLSEPGVYYFCRNAGLYKITGGNTNSPTIAQLPGISAPSAVTVHGTNGRIVVTENASSPSGTKLWLSTNGGTVWTDKTTPEWEAMGGTIKHLDWDEDDITNGANGTVHVAMYAGYCRIEAI